MAIYYVRATGGSDGNGGASFGDGWATLAYALSNISADDELRICSTSSAVFTTTVNTVIGLAKVRLVGANMTDGSAYAGTGKAYVVAGAAMTALLTTVYANIQVEDIDLDGDANADDCFYHSQANNPFNVSFVNCNFHDAIDHGVHLLGYTTTTPINADMGFHGCNIYDNGSDGFHSESTGSNQNVPVTLNDCAIYDNGGENVNSYNSCALTVINCRIFGATNSGIRYYGSIKIVNTVLYGNGSHGIDHEGYDVKANIFNCIISGNGGWGFSTASGTNYPWYQGGYNCWYNNTSGNLHANINGGTIPGSSNITSDPLFVSVASGSEDFSLQAGSPCRSVGIGFSGGK
jgi:hypothetical protein